MSWISLITNSDAGDVYQVDPGQWPYRRLNVSADSLVNDRFESVENLSDDKLSQLNQILEELKNTMNYFEMPETEIEFDPNINLGEIVWALNAIRPTPPDESEYDLPAVEAPESLDLPAFTGTKPSADLTPPTNTFNYTESQYDSALVELLKTKLYSNVDEGGSGLGSAVEEAIYERGRERLRTQYEDTHTKITRQMATSGFKLPYGAAMAMVKSNNNTYNRALDDLNRDIVVKEAELAQTNTHFMIEKSIAFEQVMQNTWHQYRTRMMEAARQQLLAAISLYEAIIKKYTAEADVYRSEAQAHDTLVRAAVSEFTARVDRSRLIIEAAVERVKAIVQVYVSQIEAYKADVDAEKADLLGQVELAKQKAEIAKMGAEVDIKEAEINLQAYLQRYNLDIESLKNVAGYLTQIAASALNAINASAQVGASASDSYSSTESYQESVSNSYGIDVFLSQDTE
jgi:hypothetical protein